MYGGFLWLVFGLVFGWLFFELVSEDLVEFSFGFCDKFVMFFGGNNVNRGRELCKIYE